MLPWKDLIKLVWIYHSNIGDTCASVFLLFYKMLAQTTITYHSLSADPGWFFQGYIIYCCLKLFMKNP